ncbi:uncharacterized protein LOC129776633 [Toxorhynchites rutilus septentrionalis]|uniref:uncharacterized protein LOC129776633 n=1 Tax=Toxorhynchites rutilus septentrionalis TaxID=329112 RepID=UPI00247845D8|nr:uncharacterized protein LOC129776633 [Toxorhynchites rutilus septentrionalis]
MTRFIVAILLFGLTTQARAQLTCFVCENCPDPFDTSSNRQISCAEPPTPPVTPPGEGTTTTPVTPQTSPDPETPILTPPPVVTTSGPQRAQSEEHDSVLSAPNPVGRWKRQSGNQISHRCFLIVHNGVTRRGCVIHVNDQMETCRNANNGIQPSSDCRICDWSGCNTAGGLKLSIAALLTALLVTIKFL